MIKHTTKSKNIPLELVDEEFVREEEWIWMTEKIIGTYKRYRAEFPGVNDQYAKRELWLQKQPYIDDAYNDYWSLFRDEDDFYD